MKKIYNLLGLLTAISILVPILTENSFAENSIGIFSIEPDISSTDNISITGFVYLDSFSRPVKLEVYDPNEDLLYNPEVVLDNRGHFSWVFYPPEGHFEVLGEYTVIASHEDLNEDAKIQFTVKEENPINTKNRITEPIEELDNYDIFIALSIASIVIGVVVWMRITYEDHSESKSLN